MHGNIYNVSVLFSIVLLSKQAQKTFDKRNSEYVTLEVLLFFRVQNLSVLSIKVHFHGVWLKLSPWIILSIFVAILYCSYRAVDFNKNNFGKENLPKNSPRTSGLFFLCHWPSCFGANDEISPGAYLVNTLSQKSFHLKSIFFTNLQKLASWFSGNP
jgi:hypothetical protein